MVERDSEMTFDLKTCRFVVWGYKTSYHTHGHIHEALHRTLLRTGRDSTWTDLGEQGNLDQGNTFFITNHDIADQLPIREDCFYLVHGLIDHPVKHRFSDFGNNWLSWNVYINIHAEILRKADPATFVMLDKDMPFWPREHHLNFRWATDRTPDEIQHNKIDAKTLHPESRVINYVGTYWHVNNSEIVEFGRACHDGGIELRHMGAGQASPEHSYLGHSKVISPDDNVRLVRESYFAPAIVGSHHLTEGYAPCRIFKNISFGQFGVTNSACVNDLFGGKLIFNPDPYQLFFTARERLPNVPLSALYELMDEVAEKHTYVNRLAGVFKASQMVLEEK